MPSVSITKRRRRNVTRYAVRYRTGGRESPVQHAGSFATRKEAKARRDLVAGELAALRNPADALQLDTALRCLHLHPPAPRSTGPTAPRPRAVA